VGKGYVVCALNEGSRGCWKKALLSLIMPSHCACHQWGSDTFVADKIVKA
jgi:hypothetical protein